MVLVPVVSPSGVDVRLRAETPFDRSVIKVLKLTAIVREEATTDGVVVVISIPPRMDEETTSKAQAQP